jgi:hypothetical protein
VLDALCDTGHDGDGDYAAAEEEAERYAGHDRYEVAACGLSMLQSAHGTVVVLVVDGTEH